MSDEENIIIIDCGNCKHVYFSGIIDTVNATALCANLVGLDFEMQNRRGEFGFKQGEETLEVDLSIKLHINSTGGNISPAFMIADTIDTLVTPVDCHVDDRCASAAVIAFLAGRNRTMAPHSIIAVHETMHSVESVSFSDIKEFGKDAKDIYEEIVDFYCEKTGKSRREIRKMFKDCTHIKASDATNLGFCRIVKS